MTPAATFMPAARAVTARLADRRAGFSSPGRPNGTAPVFSANPVTPQP